MASRAQTRPMAFYERVQERINVSSIVNRLQSHIDGEIDLTATQIQASRILLSKCIPDVKAYEIKNIDQSNAQAIDNNALRAIIDGSSKRIK